MKQTKEDKIHSALKRRRLRRARLKKVGITAAILPLVLSKGAPVVYVAARYRRNEDELGIEQVVEVPEQEIENVILPEDEGGKEETAEVEVESKETEPEQEISVTEIFEQVRSFELPDLTTPKVAAMAPLSETVHYIDANGVRHYADNVVVHDISQDEVQNLTGGWHLITGSRTGHRRIAITGDVNIILADGADLSGGGIQVWGGRSLTIWAQSTGADMGRLTANGGSFTSQAGIGSNEITEISGSITINGGTITARGGNNTRAGAGIGSGTSDRPPSFNNSITINGGIVNAYGGSSTDGGAGIGGGGRGIAGAGAITTLLSEVNITGGIVTARGGNNGGAGIGGGRSSNGVNVNITGGMVSAFGYRTIGQGARGGNAGTLAVSNSILFHTNNGTVHGNAILPRNVEIAAGRTLNIPTEASLTVPEGMGLTNRGTVNNAGTVDNLGTIDTRNGMWLGYLPNRLGIFLTPRITSIVAQESFITVIGEDLFANNMRIAAFYNNAGNPLHTQTPTGNESSVNATLPFPENNTVDDRNYTIRVSIDGGRTWLPEPVANVMREGRSVITIDKQPENVEVTYGDISGYLSVTAHTTRNATLNYQWQREISSGNWQNIYGARGSEFAIPEDLTGGSHRFRVLLNDTGRATQVISNVAVVTVTRLATAGSVDISSLQTGDWGPGGENDERYWSFWDNVLHIYDGAEVTVTGTVNNGRHIVVHGDADLTILDLNIGVGQSVTPFRLFSGRVNLTLKGQNHLEAADGWAGLQVHPQANLIISGDGYLTAIGGRYGAGIGGSMHARTPGPIRINSGTVTAQGGHEGAGIGSAANNGWTAHNGGNITIAGGSVNATGGHAGAGIGGGGHGGSGGNITISGGKVRAISYHNGSGIGGGWGGGTAAYLAISGGTVYARANGFDYANGPQGIGAGNTGQRNSGSFTLSNNAVVFAHAPNPDNRVNNHNLDMNQGLLFRGEQGRVYGAFTPVNNFTVDEDWMVRVPNGNSLTVSEGRTLTNYGQIIPELGATITIEDGATIKGNRISGAPVREFERDELSWFLLNESTLRMKAPADLLAANTGQILEFQLVDGESQTTGWQRELDFNISDLLGDDFTLQVRSQANVHFQAGIPSTARFTLDRENDWQENLVTNRIDFALFDRDAEERLGHVYSWFAFAEASRRDEFDFYHESEQFNVEADVLHFSNDFEGSYEISARHRASGQSASVRVHIIRASSQPILVAASELVDMPEDILERFVSVTLGNGETLPEDIKVEVTASDRDKFVSVEEDKLNFQFENALVEAIDGANISDNRQHKVMVGDENLRFKVSEVSQEDLESAIQLYQLNLESEGGFKELTGEDKSYKLDFDQDQVQALLESVQAGSFTVDFAFGDPVLTRGTSSRQGSGQLTIELLATNDDSENNQNDDNSENNQSNQSDENDTNGTNGGNNQDPQTNEPDISEADETAEADETIENEPTDEALIKDNDDSETGEEDKLTRAEETLAPVDEVASSTGLLGLGVMGAIGTALALRKKKK